ncbi:ferredoxin [Streptomyces longispororuber]|uniref:ferredoxin n=1 Tax=Streptomyces longispororuber TaxID=68230 RepID=UPI00340E3FDD
MDIRVDRELCVGSGNCVANVPQVFDQDDDEGLVLVHTTEVPEHLRASVELAERVCPVGAIQVGRQAPTH